MKTFKHLLIALCFSLCFYFMYSTPIDAKDTSFSGIDVSEWQGTIDFNLVKAAGIDVVYIRVAEGADYEDPYWSQNYEGAKSASLKIGFYHYITALSEWEAQEQANYFYSLIKDHQMDCLPAMDFESFSTLSTEEINQIATAYLETLSTLTGIRPMLYSDAYNVGSIWSNALTKYPLWVADYGVSQPKTTGSWSEWMGFQFSDTGSVDGVNGNIDMNYFKEGVFIQNSETTSQHSSTPLSSTSDSISYTVKSGDTLWQIAISHDTTIQSIITLNHIQNPNLIYPGEHLLIPSSNHDQSTTQQTSSNTQTYTVQSGNTLWQIANNYDTTVNKLATLNHISNPNLIYPGEVLLLPNQ